MNPLGLMVVAYYLGEFLEEMTDQGQVLAMNVWHMPLAVATGFATPIPVMRFAPLPTPARFPSP